MMTKGRGWAAWWAFTALFIAIIIIFFAMSIAPTLLIAIALGLGMGAAIGMVYVSWPRRANATRVRGK